MAKRALTWLTWLVMLLGTALFINMVGVMFTHQNYWLPRVQSGRVAFPQMLCGEWVWYYTGHRFGWISADDLPGLAFVALTVLLTGYFKWNERSHRRMNVAGTEPGFSCGEGVWPPAPKN